jgi:hypothetical protein
MLPDVYALDMFCGVRYKARAAKRKVCRAKRRVFGSKPVIYAGAQEQQRGDSVVRAGKATAQSANGTLYPLQRKRYGTQCNVTN